MKEKPIQSKASPAPLIDTGQLALTANAVVQPFVETVWEIAQDDEELINRLRSLFSFLDEEKRYAEMFGILQILYHQIGLDFTRKLRTEFRNDAAFTYFMHIYAVDFDETMEDFIAGVR